MNQSKLDRLESAMSYTGENPEAGTRAEIYIINDGAEEETRNLLCELIAELRNSCATDLAYEIVSTAIDLVVDQDGEAEDWQELADDSASVYTSTRLSYLHVSNQYEISEFVRDMDMDIETACALWYDQQVGEVCEKLSEWVSE